MPELPEVETTRRGIAPFLEGNVIEQVIVRDTRLRWPVPKHLAQRLRGARVLSVGRRAKYLLIQLDRGCLIVHLGMSGSLRLCELSSAPRAHDHVELRIGESQLLRYHDPRRFGSIHFVRDDPLQHPLLRHLGVEPLGNVFDGELLHRFAVKRRAPVKSLIMDARVVVGVGNIYASEALFLAGIHPTRAAQRVSLQRYRTLATCIRQVLGDAIAQGGTTLRDFVNESGEPGYFAQQLFVYGRKEQACRRCAHPIRARVVSQRNTFYCVNCQR